MGRAVIRPALTFTVLLLATAHAGSLRGQSLTLRLGVLHTIYGRGQYASTTGDWQAEGAVVFQTGGALGLALGASVGKLDEPSFDPSLTSLGLFLEPTVRISLADDWDARLGGRYGWAQERGGPRPDGIWAAGWEAGAVGEILLQPQPTTAVGLRLTAERLDLRRDGMTGPVPGLDRRGWRFGQGLTLALGSR